MNKAAKNIVWHHGAVDTEQRAQWLGQQGVTLWLTGLSGSGKSTVACALEQAILQQGGWAYRLDGDNVRHGLNGDLTFSPEDRVENIRRIGEVSKLFTDAGMITIVSFISPYRADRQQARSLHEEAGLRFVEVHIDCPLEVAEQRDPKGLYQKARAGEIKQFTGIDAPYEQPLEPEVTIPTHQWTVEQAVDHLITSLELIKTASN